MSNEPLPWLEPVEDEDEPPALSARKMLAAVLVVLLAAALVAGTLYCLGRRNSSDEGSGPPELIRADPNPVKIKPENPGGIDVAGDSETAFATGAGEQVDGQLDLNAVPEEAIAKPKAKAEPAPAAEESAAAAAKPEPAAPAAPNQVQLGFYGSVREADAAWKSLSGRFPSVAGAGKIIVPYQSGQRLRASFASPDEAKAACQLLKAAGDACFVVR
ncbi:SPOR domain-containing protein [Sphingomonas humi]|uniref:SPOR domain-containing protein n=1 Tax=Sphingomonas humi TaxID=335630 RepID=A0ABP7RRZ4_9SPHN